MTPKEMKKSLRREFLALRDDLEPAEATAKSHEIVEKILASRAYRVSACLYLYVDTRNEVQTKDLIQAAWRDGKHVAVPKVEDRELVFYYITSWEDLEKGYRGIWEPRMSCAMASEEDAMLILPGVAYDQMRNRIGYGGGFYDRYLACHNDHCVVAPAYDFQVIDELPTEEFDKKVPWILTETREFGGENSRWKGRNENDNYRDWKTREGNGIYSGADVNSAEE